MEEYLKEIDFSGFRNSIKEMAKEALRLLPENSPSREEAKLRMKRPLDYLRCAEFPLALSHFELKDGMKILDVGSPQWFSLVLAKNYPSINFFYLNILEREIESVKDIAKVLRIKNLHFLRGDVRNLGFRSSFDHIVSISVIEHIYPEKEGDLSALNEMKRVLSPYGMITFSIPLKEKFRVIYRDEPVYEREGKRKVFFAREYNIESLKDLISRLGLKIEKMDFIIEKKGFFSLDYWRWGEGEKSFFKFPILGSVKLFEKFFFSLEERIAHHYLYSSESLERGVICAVLTVKKDFKYEQ